MWLGATILDSKELYIEPFHHCKILLDSTAVDTMMSKGVLNFTPNLRSNIKRKCYPYYVSWIRVFSFKGTGYYSSVVTQLLIRTAAPPGMSTEENE